MKRRECPLEFDSFLKKVLEEDTDAGGGLPRPDKFEGIIASIELKRGKKRLKRMGTKLLVTFLILGVMSTGLYLFFPERVGEAKRLIITITHLFIGDVTIITGDSNYPFFTDNAKRIVDRIIQIKSEAPIDVKLPMYVPSGFIVTDVQNIDDADKFSVTLFFNRGEDSFIITQFKTPNTAGALFQDPGSEQGEAVCILGNKGFMVRHLDGNYNLNFIDERLVHFILRGDIAEDEILKIARSLH